MMINQFPRLGNVASRVRTKVGHVPHRIKKVCAIVYRAKRIPQGWIGSDSEKPHSGLLHGEQVEFFDRPKSSLKTRQLIFVKSRSLVNDDSAWDTTF